MGLYFPHTISLFSVVLQVAFVLDDDPDDAQLVAWTTTPWTLPSNLSLCVNPNFDYIKVPPPPHPHIHTHAHTYTPLPLPNIPLLTHWHFPSIPVHHLDICVLGFVLGCCDIQAKFCTPLCRITNPVLSILNGVASVAVPGFSSHMAHKPEVDILWFLCPKVLHLQVKNPATGAVYIVLESLLGSIPGAVPKAKKAKGKDKDDAAPEPGFEVPFLALQESRRWNHNPRLIVLSSKGL